MTNKERYEHWLNNAPQHVVDEISKYTEQDIEKYFAEDMEFGTAGIRGPIKYGTAFINEYTIARNAWAFGKLLLELNEEGAKKYGVVLAHDNRKNRILFTETAAKVLGGLGIPVTFFKDNELQPTPFVSYVINKYDYVGGAIVTASHNPPTDNGFKVYDDKGTQLLPQYTNRIQEIADSLENVFNLEMDDSLIKYLDDSVETEYLDEIMKEIPFTKEYVDRKDMIVTFTSQHGTAAKFAPILAEKIGITLHCVKEQCVPDENFTHTKSPNPQNPVAFDEAKKLGEQNGSELLFSTDPDSDRFGLVVRHNGEWVHITGNELPVMQLHWKLNKMKEAGFLVPEKMCAIRSIVTSSMGDKVAEEFGIAMHKTLTGFKWIVSKSLEEEKKGIETLFGWEEAYGSVIRFFSHDKDAFQAFVQVVEMAHELKQQGKTIVDYLEELYAKYGRFHMFQDTLRFEGKEAQKEMFDFIDTYRGYKIGDKIGEFEITDIWDFKDGYKDYIPQNFIFIHLDNKHWFCIRPSGTEPLLRIYYDLVDINPEDLTKYIRK